MDAEWLEKQRKEREERWDREFKERKAFETVEAITERIEHHLESLNEAFAELKQARLF